MAIKPLPSIQEVFSEVRRESSRKKIMLGPQNPSMPNPNESSALVTRNISFSTDNRVRKGGKPRCEHCKKPSHTKQTCRNLHRKPLDWKTRKSRGYTAAGQEQSAAEISPFNKE
ncbi:hypothetical protein TorRG33x02_130070 [Trema orientale]|uniref:Uncharacterized protein n=1 Tax=Trema orientale TaxID=63057 RepID=A0A2P5F096_TREOI|nr:hypothetical protein TorRG33x02_130070 [Trema orientale]